MEESKELQGFYKIFRTVVYVSVLLEFFEYAIEMCIRDSSYRAIRPETGRTWQRHCIIIQPL